jgi:hypothetical protein
MHDHGDLCEAIMELAVERRAAIAEVIRTSVALCSKGRKQRQECDADSRW